MKKKILLCLIVILALVTFTGCGNKENNNATNGSSEEKYDTFKIYDETLELNYQRQFKKLTYMTNSKDMFPNTMSNSVEIKYEDSSKVDDIVDDYGASVVRINIQYFENRSIDDVMSKAPYERTSKKVGDIEYQYFEYTDNGAKGFVYIYNYEGSTYTITFVAKIDISLLINVFMKNVVFG